MGCDKIFDSGAELDVCLECGGGCVNPYVVRIPCLALLGYVPGLGQSWWRQYGLRGDMCLYVFAGSSRTSGKALTTPSRARMITQMFL